MIHLLFRCHFRLMEHNCSVVDADLCCFVAEAVLCSAVFFNFFAAAEPYTSVKVTHGTPCIDP